MNKILWAVCIGLLIAFCMQFYHVNELREERDAALMEKKECEIKVKISAKSLQHCDLLCTLLEKQLAGCREKNRRLIDDTEKRVAETLELKTGFD